jgi:regulatory protein
MNYSDDYEKFLGRALRYLGYRPRSEKEMRDYLGKKKVDQSITERIIANLKEHKFINDEEFAQMWVNSRTNYKPRSTRIIKMELKQKGISDDVIEETMDKKSEEVSDFDMALDLAQRKLKRLEKEEPQKRKEKLAGFLGRKGFGWDVIKEVIIKLNI